MPDADLLERIWIGKDERGGHPGAAAQGRRAAAAWRLETVAYATRPRSLAVSPDRRTAVFIEDRDTSDLHVLDLDAAARTPSG